MLNIKNEIKSAFLENKTAVYISIILLLGTLIAGYVLQPYLQSIFDPVVDKLTEDVKNGVITLTFQTIFTNNILIIFQNVCTWNILFFSGVILATTAFCRVIIQPVPKIFLGFYYTLYLTGFSNFHHVYSYCIRICAVPFLFRLCII